MKHDQLAFTAADPIDEHNPLVLPRLRDCDPSQRGAGMVPAPAPLSASGQPLPVSPPPLIPSFSHAAGKTTFAGVPVAAIEAVMVERTRQVRDFGHTTDKDLTLRPSVLPDRASRYLVNAQEDLQFRSDGHRQRARRHLAQAGAMVLAAIDYLDAGGGQ
jgi:hypothetical protein